jgi:hypothetical protein
MSKKFSMVAKIGGKNAQTGVNHLGTSDSKNSLALLQPSESKHTHTTTE